VRESVFHPWLKIGYPILIHTVFKYAGSARLMGKFDGCALCSEGASEISQPHCGWKPRPQNLAS
jgi:hypothetical protein